jgi:hypothetical protein
MRAFILTTLAFLAFSSAALAAPCRDAGGKFIKCPVAVVLVKHPNCKVGKACGGSCIAMDKVCHKPM